MVKTVLLSTHAHMYTHAQTHMHARTRTNTPQQTYRWQLRVQYHLGLGEGLYIAKLRFMLGSVRCKRSRWA